jgi:hypothetical protein
MCRNTPGDKSVILGARLSGLAVNDGFLHQTAVYSSLQNGHIEGFGHVAVHASIQTRLAI